MFISSIASIVDAMRAEIVDLGHLEMCYEREGNGEPLLLLHGATGCHDDWIYAGRDEFAREYSVIAPDARGHGATSNPDATITHQQCAVDMVALLDRLGIGKFRAIGVSMGANILLHMATMQPDRIDAMVVVSATMGIFRIKHGPLCDGFRSRRTSDYKSGRECGEVISAASNK